MSVHRHSRPFRAVLVLASIFALSLLLYADHSWGPYHWARQSNPFTLQLGDNVHSGWDAHLREASADWSVSSVLNTMVVAGSTSARQCKPSLGKVEVCAEKYGFNGWLGIAQIWISGSHITQGITKLNDSYFNTSTYNTPAWKLLVMCQEVGHTFGLDHQDENFNNANLGTCMDYTSSPAGNEHPNAHDYEQLEAIYGHLDSTTTVAEPPAGDGGDGGGGGPGNGKGKKDRGNMPPAMTDIELTGPEQWGRVVRGSRAAGHTTHVLDFGGGHKVVTFVIWAAERGNSER